MKTWKNLRIRTLIEENQSHNVLQQCTSLLERSDIKSNISHRVSVQDLIDAYEQDSTSSPDKPVHVDGVNELLSNLRKTDETYLRLVTLKTEREDTVVFTDPNLNHVIGALRILRAKMRLRQPSANLTEDQQFFDSMGPEVGPQSCREPGCSRLRISGSVRCRNHLFEMVKGRAYNPKPDATEKTNQEETKSNNLGSIRTISVLA